MAPPDTTVPGDGSLARKAVGGSLWNALTFAGTKLSLLISTAIVARVLTPDEFGLVALGLLVLAYLDVLGDLGVGPAVIYKRDLSEQGASTAVVIAAGTGLLLCLSMVLVAPVVAALFSEPSVTDVLRVLAVAFFVDMLGVVHESKLKKDLAFERRAVPEMAKSLSKGMTSIVLAFAGFGVWSLVYGQLMGSLVGTTLYWRLSSWSFVPSFDRAVAASLLRFGLPVTLLGMLGVLVQTMDYLVIGQRLDAVALGLYTIAFRVPEILLLNFCVIVSQALFPAYAKATDAAQLQRGFLTTLRLVAVVTVPVGLGLAAVAPDVLVLVFGSQWAPAGPVMQVLAIYAMLYSLTFNVGDLYKARGRPGILSWMALARVVLTLPILWVLAPEGILAVAVGVLVSSAVMMVVELFVARRLLAVRLGTLLRQYVPAVSAGLVMFGAAMAFRHFLVADAPLVLRLASTVLLGGVVYLVVLALVSRETVVRLLNLVRRSAPQR